jgi:hypothetical protein
LAISSIGFAARASGETRDANAMLAAMTAAPNARLMWQSMKEDRDDMISPVFSTDQNYFLVFVGNLTRLKPDWVFAIHRMTNFR